MDRGAPAGMTALSQITENRKVDPRKLLICQPTIFRFCLQKTTLRQSPVPGVPQLRAAACQLTPAFVGPRANQGPWFSEAVVVAYAGDGGGTARSRVVPERGAALSGAAVVTAADDLINGAG